MKFGLNTIVLTVGLGVIAAGVLFIGFLMFSVVAWYSYRAAVEHHRRVNEPPWGWEADRMMRAP